MPKTLQPWKAKQTVWRTVDAVGMEAKKILRLSNLMSKIKKCIHLLCQNLASSSLQHSYNARKRLGFWESRWTKAVNIQHGAIFDSCLLCLFAWELFALGFLGNAVIQQRHIHDTHCIYFQRSTNQRKPSLSLNKMFLIPSCQLSISQQYFRCLLKT